jgi:Flp pilus assembly protein TadG
MTRRINRIPHRTHDGQIIVLTALMLVVLIAIAGLAIDVSAAYLADRWQRSVADAAALAGAQDLQIPGSRQLPGPTQQQQARVDSMTILVHELGSTGNITTLAGQASCQSAAGCPLPGTPYVVTVRTPSPSCVDCRDAPSQAMQVAVRQPSFGLTFARIFGQTNWSVNTTSVAAIEHGRAYGIVTLRPPDPRTNGTDANQQDLFITGGSQVIVGQADAGVNTNLVYSGTNSLLQIDSGFNLFYHDTYKAWTGAPTGIANGSLITDPGYTIPPAPSVTAYSDYSDAEDTSGCAAQKALVPSTYRDLKTNLLINDPGVPVRCFKPGIYNFTLTNNTDGTAFLLEPGVYYFNAGLSVGANVIGGYVPSKPGVALVFQEAQNQSGVPGQFTTNRSTSTVALNFGDKDQHGGTSGSWAQPAGGPSGPVGFPDPNGGPIGIPMSILVQPDTGCQVVEPEPSTCNDNHNLTLKLTGGGNIFLAGVQYAPSDNAQFSGNTGQTSEVGQLITWTLTFNSSVFNINAWIVDTNGALRIDPACSPTVNVCTQ